MSITKSPASKTKPKSSSPPDSGSTAIPASVTLSHSLTLSESSESKESQVQPKGGHYNDLNVLTSLSGSELSLVNSELLVGARTVATNSVPNPRGKTSSSSLAVKSQKHIDDLPNEILIQAMANLHPYDLVRFIHHPHTIPVPHTNLFA
jgi:hypothetical protein